jgi:hypothetical protein
MTLGEVVSSLDSLSDDLCIVARRPWTATGEAMLVRTDAEFRIPSHVRDAGYEYFLEVSILRDEVLEAVPKNNIAQRIAIAIYYAENDAYPPANP